MNPRLSTELIDALHAGDGEVRVVDPTTERIYVLIDDETHRRAMQALREQSDWNAIKEGIEQADRGEGMSLKDMDQQIRQEFSFPARQ